MISILLCNVAMAQWKVGFALGLDLNRYDYDTQWAYRLQYGGHSGVEAGIPVAYSINDFLEISSGIAYQEKGFSLENMSDFSHFKVHNNLDGYIERTDYHLTVPICAKFLFGGVKVKGFASLGSYASFWMASYFDGYTLSTATLSYEYFHDKKDYDRKIDNRFEVGLIGGVGVSYQYSQDWSWFFIANYYYALTDQHKDYQLFRFPAYNRTFTFQIGIMYNI